MQSLHFFHPRYDAVIVGARCAGAATALLLARAGAKVLLVDRQAYGSDTMSTHAIMRTGVLQLQRWGLLPIVMAATTPEIRSTTFHYGTEQLRIKMKPEHGLDYLAAPRRTVLDRILVDAARAAGADVRHGVQLSDLHYGAAGRVIGATLTDDMGQQRVVRSDIVIGADGKQSTVAKLVYASKYRAARTTSACVYGYFENLERQGFHWHFADGVAASIMPTNHAQHCVVASVPDAAFSKTFRGQVEEGFFQVLRENSPVLHDDVRRAKLVGRLRGFAGGLGFMRQAHGPGWALVGDAGYFKDPLTAHGITDALRDAEILARAVLSGRPQSLQLYQDMRDELSHALFDITDDIASFRWNMEQVKTLHTQLSAAMRAETDYMASLSSAGTIAA
jgi:menaquinone-9 beta-reductase